MRCMKCAKDKLSHEFPRKNFTKECEHAALYCFRCTAEHVDQEETCPDPGCRQVIKKDDPRVKAIEAAIVKLFHGGTPSAEPELVSGSDVIQIVLLDGTREKIACSSDTTIFSIKKHIERCRGLGRHKQRLLYKGKELKALKKSGWNTLKDYNIPTNSTLHLMIVLYDIPEDLDHVIFDIYWKVPPHVRCDFLDASCLLYDDYQRCTDIIDYANEAGFNPTSGKAVVHSGDSMDRVKRIGQHRIEVKLKSIPAHISHLIFTLSAWNSTEIKLFGQPSLRFYEANNIFKYLCEKALSDTIDKQAVVVCCLYKIDDKWTIFESGKMCDGNTDNYTAIKHEIQEVFQYCD